ncbi:WRKY transcription factor 55 [Diospyros lotus]|uniref:WRKY transcription factor 55 n=1 Tax=Diospyros lotus TaxID=55363 RepID=UPI0022594D3C|nr:WRKY transcription factor 55 [Diospyros lotus]
MEEISALIFQGCKLARELESNFPHLAGQPEVLSDSCDQILRLLAAAKAKLNVGDAQMVEPGERVEEWLRYGRGEAMGLHPRELFGAGNVVHGTPEGGKEMEVLGGGDGEDSEMFGAGGGEGRPPAVAGDHGGSSSSQRPRRRNVDGGKRRVLMPAPLAGNTEIPPDDGYTWRKYGQKEILGSKFPRSYYRCTHQRLYHCPAKKQVQRLDGDPFTFQVTYRGDHTCHMSSTAPTSSPPVMTQFSPTTTQSPPSAWLLDIKPTGEDLQVGLYRGFGLSGGGGTSSTTGSTGVGSGPLGARYGREVDNEQLLVADLADVMFNSASSSNNSMELIFSAMDDHKQKSREEQN